MLSDRGADRLGQAREILREERAFRIIHGDELRRRSDGDHGINEDAAAGADNDDGDGENGDAGDDDGDEDDTMLMNIIFLLKSNTNGNKWLII